MTLACGRCGRRAAMPETGPQAVAQPRPFTCVECGQSADPLRYCNRCGNETPEPELAVTGHCEWCNAAEEIPWEEPDE